MTDGEVLHPLVHPDTLPVLELHPSYTSEGSAHLSAFTKVTARLPEVNWRTLNVGQPFVVVPRRPYIRWDGLDALPQGFLGLATTRWIIRSRWTTSVKRYIYLLNFVIPTFPSDSFVER